MYAKVPPGPYQSIVTPLAVTSGSALVLLQFTVAGSTAAGPVTVKPGLPSETAALAVAVQPLASVIVNEYRPAVTRSIFCVVAPLLHANVIGVVPPNATFTTRPVCSASLAGMPQAEFSDSSDTPST